MTTVARQVPIGSGPQAATATMPAYHTTPSPRPRDYIPSNGRVSSSPAQGQGSPARQAQNGNGSRNWNGNGSDNWNGDGKGKSPPPLPPTRTTSSQKVQVKEDVAFHNGTKRQMAQRQAPAEQNLLSIFDSRNVNGSEYSRQRSNTDSSGYSQVAGAGPGPAVGVGPRGGGGGGGGGGKQMFSTVQWRGETRLNPYTTASAAAAAVAAADQLLPVHTKFSSSQPHLNKIDQQVLVRPNDRIKKSMFDQESGDEEDPQDGDYGSGYMPNLMKISRGVIQQHTVAVTTPTVPHNSNGNNMTRLNRFGSDPNMLETGVSSLDAPRKTREGIPKKGGASGSNGRRNRTNSLSAASGGSGGTNDPLGGTPIARAYREHLIEKMEKRKNSSSVSPSPSDSSADGGAGGTNHTLPGGGGGASGGEGLSSKLRSLLPSQLQGIDVPDRAYYPRILPPPSVDKQELSLVTRNNEQAHSVAVATNNPFLLHSSAPPIAAPQSAGYDTADSVGGGGRFSYGTMPRNHGNVTAGSSVNRGGVPIQSSSANMMGYKDRTQNHNHHEGLSYDSSVSSSQSSSQQSSDGSQQQDTAALRLQQDNWRSRINHHHGGQPAAGMGVAVGSHDPHHHTAVAPVQQQVTRHQLRGPGRITTNNNNNNEPQVLPKPSNPLIAPPPPPTQGLPFYHERSTSDPALSYYSHAPAATTTTTMTNHQGLASDSDAQQPPWQQLHQHGVSRGKGGRSQQQHQQQQHQQLHLSTSLLEIRESDEAGMGEREGSSKRQTSKAGKRKSRGGLKLSEYVSINSAHLPKRVRVMSEGPCCYSGESGGPSSSLSQGDELDLHFVRELKAALVVDSAKTRYTVPINTQADFSVVYDPFRAERLAKLGFQFKTAGAIMDLKKPPHVVAATRDSDGGSFDSSVEAGEVLVLQGVRNVFHGRLLEAYSLRHQTTKFVDESCAGDFTTAPGMVRMSLAQIYTTHVPLPSKVLMHVPTDSGSSLGGSIPASSYLRSEPALLKRFSMHRSVVGTPVSPAGASQVSKMVVSIPLGVDVSVQEVQTTDWQLQTMRQRSQMLVDNFKAVSVTHYLDMPSPESHAAQCALFQNLDPELDLDDATTSSSSTQTKYRKDAKRTTATAIYVAVPGSGPATHQALDRKAESRINALEGKYASLEGKMAGVREQLAKVSLKVDQVHSYLSKAQNAMSKHKMKKARSQSDLAGEGEGGPEGDGRKSTGSTTSGSSIRSSSRGSSYGRAENSSGSENIDGNEARPFNDDVFVATTITRPRSASTNVKPAILPKPKQLIRRRSSEVKVRAAAYGGGAGGDHEGKLGRQFPVSSSSNSMKGVVPATKGVVVVAPAGDIKKFVASAKKDVVPTTDANKGVAPFVSIIKKDAVPVEENDIYDSLANYSSIGSNIEDKQEISKISGSKATGILDMEFKSADTTTDDLTDWCLQVEDELTQLYNESMLSVS